MVVVVFDSDVVIGLLDADDAHHEAAVTLMRAAVAPGADSFINQPESGRNETASRRRVAQTRPEAGRPEGRPVSAYRWC